MSHPHFSQISLLLLLRAQLATAEARTERVLLFCHLSCLLGSCAAEALLWDYEDAAAALDDHPGVVAAWVSGGDKAGAYARDGRGVHHLTVGAAVTCEPNEDAFGLLEVFDDRLKLNMLGRPPNPNLRPQGWPEHMLLPQGGKLVESDGDNFSFVSAVVRF